MPLLGNYLIVHSSLRKASAIAGYKKETQSNKQAHKHKTINAVLKKKKIKEISGVTRLAFFITLSLILSFFLRYIYVRTGCIMRINEEMGRNDVANFVEC